MFKTCELVVDFLGRSFKKIIGLFISLVFSTFYPPGFHSFSLQLFRFFTGVGLIFQQKETLITKTT